MRILIATGIYPPDIGGPATYSKLLYDELPKRGIEVSVLSFGEVRSLPKILRHFSYLFKTYKRSKSTDVIFAQDPVSVGLPALYAAKLRRKKFILKVVGDYAWEQYVLKNPFVTPEEFQHKNYWGITSIRRCIERHVAKHADSIIVPSNYLKKLVCMWGVDDSKIEVIYNTSPKINDLASRSAARELLKVKGHLIVSAGRIVPWKGLDLLIDVVSDLNDKFKDLRLVIAGDGPVKSLLEKKVQIKGLEDTVVFTGSLERQVLHQYIRAADIFVLNTGYEGLSHLLLEVMQIGTPIVTTNVGGNPELIKDNFEGILVKWRDQSALSTGISNILKSPKEGKILASSAIKKAETFSREKMLNEISVHLRRL